LSARLRGSTLGMSRTAAALRIPGQTQQERIRVSPVLGGQRIGAVATVSF
jgi:hypothetical protein